jgi:hypothetical protein
MNGLPLNVETTINLTNLNLDLLMTTEESRLLPASADDETCEKLSLDVPVSTSKEDKEEGKSLFLSKYGCRNVWKWYLLALDQQPVITKSFSAFVILAAADMVSQLVEQSHSSTYAATSIRLQGGRMARFGLLGLCGTPFVHFYYDWLDVKLPPDQPCSRSTWLKLFIDQGLQAPFVTCFIFIFVGVMEGKNVTQIQEQLCEDYPSTLIANCTCAYACYCQLSNEKDDTISLLTFFNDREALCAGPNNQHGLLSAFTTSLVYQCCLFLLVHCSLGHFASCGVV